MTGFDSLSHYTCLLLNCEIISHPVRVFLQIFSDLIETKLNHQSRYVTRKLFSVINNF